MMDDTGLGVTLKKLSMQEGEWVLEVERMVPLGRFMHQPVPQQIQGERLIGKHLRAFPELLTMVESTEGLMTQPSDSEDSATTYEIWQGGWMEEDMVKLLSLQQAKKAVATAGGDGASRAAVVKLERLHRKLADRVAEVESGNVGDLAVQLKSLGGIIESFGSRLQAIEAKLGIEPVAAAAPVAAVAEPAAAAPVAAVAEPAAAAPVAAVAAAAPVAAAAAAAPVVAGAAAPVAGPAAAAPVAEPTAAEEPEEGTKKKRRKKKEKRVNRLRPPSVVAMRQSMSVLMGTEVGLKELKEPVELDVDALFSASILDDEGTVVGVMIADAEATVRLASALLMLPQAEVDEQLGSGEISEDSIETMSEIFNTMSATINNVKSNPHVRTSAMGAFDLADWEWVETTNRRVDAEVEMGGFLVLAAI